MRPKRFRHVAGSAFGPIGDLVRLTNRILDLEYERAKLIVRCSRSYDISTLVERTGLTEKAVREVLREMGSEQERLI